MKMTIVHIKRREENESERYVAQIFRTRETAYRFANKQDKPVEIRKLNGVWKVGKEIPSNVSCFVLYPNYIQKLKKWFNEK